MTEGPEWFAPKLYGYGAGVPIAWQGWAILVGYLAIAIGASAAFRDRPLILFAIIIPATFVLIWICSKTTRGGWRWRWGRRD